MTALDVIGTPPASLGAEVTWAVYGRGSYFAGDRLVLVTHAYDDGSS